MLLSGTRQMVSEMICHVTSETLKSGHVFTGRIEPNISVKIFHWWRVIS